MDVKEAEHLETLENRISDKKSAQKEAATILQSIKDYGRHLWMGRDRREWPKKIRILEKLERIARGH